MASPAPVMSRPFQMTQQAPTMGLAALGQSVANTSQPPARTPPMNGAAGTPWDFSPMRNQKGSKTLTFDWDPDNPTLGGDAAGLFAHSTFGAGAAPGASLKMALRGADGQTLFDSGDTGSLSNLTSGKLAKGRYSLQIDPSDPNAEWHMNFNKRGAGYYDNGGVVSTPSITDWSGGTDPGSWDRNQSAAQWDAGAQQRWQEGQAVNQGYGAALNPNVAGGLQTDGTGQAVGPGNPLGRGPGAPVMPGGNTAGPGGLAPDGINQVGTDSQGSWDANLNLDGLPAIDTDFTGAAQRGADAAYRQASQFFDEDFGQQREAMEAQLLSQGLQPGSEAYERAMSRMERGQNAARTNAALTAQGVGHSQAGDLLLRALQARGQGVNERFGMTDRRLTGRGQDITRDTTGLNASLAMRRLGLDEDNQGFMQLMQLLSQARGGVNMPNFGGAAPLDVAGANQIAAGNANAAANRSAADRSSYAQILGTVLGSWLK